MTYDNFTVNAQESILKAQQLAGALNQQGVDTVHLIKGTMETDAKLTEFLFSKMGINVALLRKKTSIWNWKNIPKYTVLTNSFLQMMQIKLWLQPKNF
jgi:ATP-dependent Clp protease ATP-binding subunit ClpA